MVGILEDKDRIFTNLYGLQDFRLEAAMRRGIWNGTADMLAQTPEWICDQIKASGLRGRGGAGFNTGLEVDLHAEGAGAEAPTIWSSTPTSPSRLRPARSREILRWEPHRLIESCLIACCAMASIDSLRSTSARRKRSRPRQNLDGIRQVAEAAAAGLTGHG